MTAICLDVRYLTPQPTGVGRYIQKLCEGLLSNPDPDFHFLCLGPQSTLNALTQAGLTFEPLLSPSPPETHPGHDLWMAFRLPSLLRIHQIQLFHALAFTGPTFPPPCPWISTIHDTACYQVADSLPLSFRFFLRLHLWQSCRHAHSWITMSHAVKNELDQLYHCHPPIQVIPLGTSPLNENRVLPHPFPDKKPYILFVGTTEKRKGVTPLLQCFAALHQSADAPQVDLVLCGRWDEANTKLMEAWDHSPCQNKIHRRGYVTEQELASFYHHASLVAIPSRYEGFGLPLLEAMGGQAPILVQDLPVFQETGGGLVYPADFNNTSATAKRMIELVQDTKENNRSLAYKDHVQKFSWKNLVNSTLDLYRSILAEK